MAAKMRGGLAKMTGCVVACFHNLTEICPDIKIFRLSGISYWILTVVPFENRSNGHFGSPFCWVFEWSSHEPPVHGQTAARGGVLSYRLSSVLALSELVVLKSTQKLVFV
jgi:hypothetical protein